VTTDVRDEAAKNGVVRRHVTGVMRPGVLGPEAADLEAMCRHIAELARTRAEAPRRIRVEHLGTALEIEWPSPMDRRVSSAGFGAGLATGLASGVAAGTRVAEHSSAAPDSPAVDDGMQRVCAPMIGTFFHAPEPGAPPFVTVGDSVVPGQQIGILEVMKMMSSVEAHVAGTVREILVPDGGAVEFQQALIVVEPATPR
jgi:acetyl-CoA carboxylase biotin carboxyl carrier protein